MSNDSPLFEVVIPDDPNEGSEDSSRDERVDDIFREQEDDDETEILLEQADATTTPNLFQQAWGYSQSTPIFDRNRRRSVIDPLRQPSTPSLFGILPNLRTGFQSQFRSQPVVPPLPPPAPPQATGNNQPIVPPVRPTARAATAAPTRPPAAQKPQGATAKQAKQTFVLNGEVLLIGSSRQAAPTTSDCLFKKEDRAALPADERHKIIEEATTKSKLPKFKPLQLAMAKNKGGKDKDSELLK
jgi:hypothetical protein